MTTVNPKTNQEDIEPQPSTSKEESTKEIKETYELTDKDDQKENATETDPENTHQIEEQQNEDNVSLPNTMSVKEEVVAGSHDGLLVTAQVRPQITITADSTPSPDSKESLKRHLERTTTSSNENHAKVKCPIYFGIKSYLHDFYDPPDKDVVNSGEYIQEDDFEFVVEPGKRRWRDCWFRTGLWVGINLILLGIIALLVGHLTPVRNTIVGHQDNIEILDRWAITFNRRLELCRLAGLVIFCCGGIVVMITMLISSYQQEATYYVMGATVIPEMFVGNPLIGQRHRLGTGRIPVTGTIRSVQPMYLCPNK